MKEAAVHPPYSEVAHQMNLYPVLTVGRLLKNAGDGISRTGPLNMLAGRNPSIIGAWLQLVL
jgi:hypothetical protein